MRDWERYELFIKSNPPQPTAIGQLVGDMLLGKVCLFPDSGEYGDAFDDMPWEYLEWRGVTWSTIMRLSFGGEDVTWVVII